MAQLLVSDLDGDIEVKLQSRASRNGRSMEEEVRQILRNAVREEAGIPDPLEVLRDEFDSLVARMQTPKAKDAGTALFARSGPKQT